MRRPVTLFTLLFLVLALAACQTAATTDVPAVGDSGWVENILLEDGSTLYFPRQVSGNHPARPKTLLDSQLVLQDGCLRVVTSDYKTLGFLILWPAEAVPRVAEGGTLEVLDGSGNVIGRLDEPVRMGGGAIEDESSMAMWEGQIEGMPIESCPGPYWVAGVLYPIAQVQDTPMPQSLATPYAQQPAAGICAEFDSPSVRVSLRPDVPDPRCVRVRPNQHLSIKNDADQRLQVSIAGFQAELDPGQEITFETPFGEYLAPGVHQLTTSAPPGGPEIWLVDNLQLDVPYDCSNIERLSPDSPDAQQIVQDFMTNFTQAYPTEYMGFEQLWSVDRLVEWAIIQGMVTEEEMDAIVVRQVSQGFEMVARYTATMPGPKHSTIPQYLIEQLPDAPPELFYCLDLSRFTG